MRQLSELRMRGIGVPKKVGGGIIPDEGIKELKQGGIT
jgi:methylmalonyl-CoA mutase cobalamin-binding subunit